MFFVVVYYANLMLGYVKLGLDLPGKVRKGVKIRTRRVRSSIGARNWKKTSTPYLKKREEGFSARRERNRESSQQCPLTI